MVKTTLVPTRTRVYATLLTVLLAGFAGLSVTPTASAFTCPNPILPIVTGLTSSTHPSQSTYYGRSSYYAEVYLDWDGQAYDYYCTNSWVRGYSFAVYDEGSTATPDCVMEMKNGSPHISFIGYDYDFAFVKKTFKVRAIDNHDQCGNVYSYTFYNDDVSPHITGIFPPHQSTVTNPLEPIQVFHNDNDWGADPNSDFTDIATSRTQMSIDANWQDEAAYFVPDEVRTTDFKFIPDTNWEKGYHNFNFRLADTAIGSYATSYAGSNFKMDCSGDLFCEAEYVRQSVLETKEETQDDTGSPSENACESREATPGPTLNSLTGPHSIIGGWARREAHYNWVFGKAYNEAQDVGGPVVEDLSRPVHLNQAASFCYQSVVIQGALERTDHLWDSL